jgi:hypothetical protein
LCASRASTALFAALALSAGATTVSAHRQDEYLHAARIAIAPEGVRVELSLTPGIAVADAVIRDIDADGDTTLSPAEQRRYAERVLRGISLRVDGRDVALAVAGIRFAQPAALRNGDVAITLEAASPSLRLTPGTHQIAFHNGNAAHGAVYLANALMPDGDQVAITKLAHAVDQSHLTVAFTVRPSTGWRWPLWRG